MDRQDSTAATLECPAPPLQPALAMPHAIPRPMPRARLDPGEVQGACEIARAVVATALDQVQVGLSGSFPQAAPVPARAAAFSRQIAMYLAHVGFGLSMAEVGRAFERDRTTVVHACHLVEDRRDEVRFDQLLDHLEQIALRTAKGINRARLRRTG